MAIYFLPEVEVPISCPGFLSLVLLLSHLTAVFTRSCFVGSSMKVCNCVLVLIWFNLSSVILISTFYIVLFRFLADEQKASASQGLTSLRFIAAITIFILHARNHDLIPDSFLSSFDLSKSVSLFFVLSGFVISYAYSNEIFIFSIYSCRFARIWPAAMLSIFFVLFLFVIYTSSS